MTPATPAIIELAKRTAGQHPSDLVAVYAMDQTCSWASPTHLTILGYSENEMLGRPWKEFVAPEDHAHASLAGDDALLHGRSIDFSISAVTKTGGRVALRGQAWISIDQNTHMGFLFFQASRRSSG